jgi:hypothetical protein
MVAKRKLTIETLSKLGRRKLAELLIAEAVGNRQLPNPQPCSFR